MVDVRRVVAVAGALVLGSAVWAQGSAVASPPASEHPIADALASVDEDVRLYDEHIVILASPYMQGRLPGTPGMERAKDYVEDCVTRYGLEPAFNGGASYRDPFELGGGWKVTTEQLAALGKNGSATFEADKDYVFTALGGSGSILAQAVFVGYAIDDGPEGFTSFGDDTDLAGKVAVMFRFEPMDDTGRSVWTGGAWSGAASFTAKLRAVRERGAAAAVIINPPGTDDPRAGRLDRFETSGGTRDAFPVMMMTPEAGDRLFALSKAGGTAADWRKKADKGDAPTELGVAMTVVGKGERIPTMAENVGGVIPGKGALADEWIVVGAHLDHLGMGHFGSMVGPGKVHLGADDNASGSAGLLVAAKALSERLAHDDTDRRSILFLWFSGEESGLNGSKHYVSDPIAPLDRHVLMINWDMIGRVQHNRVSVSGLPTGEGLAEFVQPFFDASGLEVQTPKQIAGNSDHASFYYAGVPVLFGIIGDSDPDYHTPRDVSWKINRVGAVKTVRMFDDIIVAAAERAERFAYVEPTAETTPRPSGPGSINVRFGVMPANYDETGEGVPIGQVSPGGPAEKGGVQAGDVLVRWNGQDVTGVIEWMEMLGAHKPGDVVEVVVRRDGKAVTLSVTLEGRTSAP